MSPVPLVYRIYQPCYSSELKEARRKHILWSIKNINLNNISWLPDNGVEHKCQISNFLSPLTNSLDNFCVALNHKAFIQNSRPWNCLMVIRLLPSSYPLNDKLLRNYPVLFTVGPPPFHFGRTVSGAPVVNIIVQSESRQNSSVPILVHHHSRNG